MQNAKRPRIADVARVASVSESAVSAVINGRVGQGIRVSEETQQRIWDAVNELGYVANPLAKRLREGQNRLIGIFTFESMFPIHQRDFYYPFLIGIELEAEKRGYDLMLATASKASTNGKRRIYDQKVNRLQLADGALLLGHENSEDIKRLLADNFPFVFIGRREYLEEDISYVAADYVTATQHVVDDLVKHGHHHITYVRAMRDNIASQDRMAGFQRAVEQYQLPIQKNNIHSAAAETLSVDWFASQLAAGTTAFVTQDDMLGMRLLELARVQGKQCPDDFSLAVLGNPLNPDYDVPDWTHINIPRQEMGRQALSILVEQLNNVADVQNQIVLGCNFVTGTSVKQIG